MEILYDRDGIRVEVTEVGDRRRITVAAPGYVPCPEIETAYPLSLIRRLIEVKGPVWFADEIRRDEDPHYVQRTIKWGTLPFVDPSELATARVLDFGCGSGASTAILARTYPKAEIVGVELDPALLEIAQARADFYGLPNIKMLASPSPDRLPDNIGTFDAVNLSAVLEHLLPNERKALLPMLWDHLRPGGTLFIYETPHRFFPIETHTTGLPLINYLPAKMAHAVINTVGRRDCRGHTWPHMLRAGIRGGTIREVLGIIGKSAKLLPPKGMDRLGLWHAKASEGRRPQRSKDLVYNALRTIRAVTRIELLPEMSIAVRKA